MLQKTTLVVLFFLGLTNVIKADADPQPETDEFGQVVDHGKVKKYFLELYNEALSKATKEQEKNEYDSNSEKRGFNFGMNSFKENKNEELSPFSSSKFPSPKFTDSDTAHGFSGFNRNPVRSQVPHTSHRRGGHHHKHQHHKHSHQHENDHKHAHKHLHEQSHEHKHSAKHQHVHKHEHHHEHNHHHKHKEDHEHKQDHKHAHKHLHAHKGNSWRRQGEEDDHVDRRQDLDFEPINAEVNLEEEIFPPLGSPIPSYMKKPMSPTEYQEIEYDAWEQI